MDWKILSLAVTLGVFFFAGVAPAGGNYGGPDRSHDPTGESGSHFVENVINLGVDPAGTHVFSSATFDCEPCFLGFGGDRWDFTLTAPTDVTVEVNDCCIEGDRYEARCNNLNEDEDGDGSLDNHGEDCIFGSEDVNVPVGVFANLGTVTMEPGDWAIRVRDIQFQCGQFNPGCAAGYSVRITFGAPTGQDCAGIASCFDPANGVGVTDPACMDTSLPRNTPPVASCAESVNPSGEKTPPAGSTTLPGPKGGQNEDGFYELIGEDAEDGTADVFVTNASGSATFGPFASGSTVKITEDPDEAPVSKPMGGPNSAVAAHIILDSDAFIFAVDSAGEESPVVSCLVPPLPK